MKIAVTKPATISRPLTAGWLKMPTARPGQIGEVRM
jgi:hypothetical protein